MSIQKIGQQNYVRELYETLGGRPLVLEASASGIWLYPKGRRKLKRRLIEPARAWLYADAETRLLEEAAENLSDG